MHVTGAYERPLHRPAGGVAAVGLKAAKYYGACCLPPRAAVREPSQTSHAAQDSRSLRTSPNPCTDRVGRPPSRRWRTPAPPTTTARRCAIPGSRHRKMPDVLLRSIPLDSHRLPIRKLRHRRRPRKSAMPFRCLCLPHQTGTFPSYGVPMLATHVGDPASLGMIRDLWISGDCITDLDHATEVYRGHERPSTPLLTEFMLM